MPISELALYKFVYLMCIQVRNQKQLNCGFSSCGLYLFLSLEGVLTSLPEQLHYNLII